MGKGVRMYAVAYGEAVYANALTGYLMCNEVLGNWHSITLGRLKSCTSDKVTLLFSTFTAKLKALGLLLSAEMT